MRSEVGRHRSASERGLGTDGMAAARGLNAARVDVGGERGELVARGDAEQVAQVGVRRRGELPDRADTDALKPGAGDRTHAPDQPDRQRIEERALLTDRHHDEPVGLRDLRRDFRQVLGAGDADRDGQPDLRP